MDVAPHGTLMGVIRPAEDRRALLTFATTDPVSDGRPDVSYVLDMNGGDFTFLKSGCAPLLADHRAHLDAILGVIEDAWTDATTAQAIVRFGTSPAAAAAWADVQAGVIANVSVGFRIRGYAPSTDPTVERISHWWPYEISLVAIPANINARVRGPMANADIASYAARTKEMFLAAGRAHRRLAVHAVAWKDWAAIAASSVAAECGTDVDAVAPVLARLVDEHIETLIVE